MRKVVATDMAALNKHGYEVVSSCLPENRSIRFTMLTLHQKIDKYFEILVDFYFFTLHFSLNNLVDFFITP